VDGVRAKEGPDLWPDRYEYLNDGMKRLERQWAAGDAAGLIKGAGLWKDLIAIVGDKGIAPIFRAWGKAAVDPADPAESLRKVLLASGAREPTAAWLSRAKDAFLQKRPKSEFAAGTVEPNQLAGRPQELAHDDGQAAGKRSIAGSGHAVRFEAPGESSYLTAVRIHGSRYGQPAPPKEDFRVWLCDKDFKAIAEFQHPYAKFQWGKPQWVTLRVKPTRVPREFIVCVGFQPTATKGVFLSHDAGGEGNSLTGLPGAKATRFSQGDWLIRVSVDQLK
jgi:RNA polymerase sigma-70 factor (ECF subfamily)